MLYFLLILMTTITIVLAVKLRFQKSAHYRRMAIAKEVHKLLNDPNAPAELLDRGLWAVQASFDMNLLRKVLIHYVRHKDCKPKTQAFNGDYRHQYHIIMGNLGMAMLLNSPFLSAICVFYLLIKLGTTKLDEKIASIGADCGNNHYKHA